MTSLIYVKLLGGEAGELRGEASPLPPLFIALCVAYILVTGQA